MENTLERFRIIGLHDQKTIDATIRNNTLILVGENGSGKTTFLRILFYFLSGRWLSLVQFRFEYIVATVAGHEYKVSHEELVNAFKGVDRRFLSSVPPSIRRKILEFLERGETERASYELSRFSGRHSSPLEIMRQLEFLEEDPKGPQKGFNDAIKKIHSSIDAQILYLPTYRRIERELNSIFEGADTTDLQRSRNQIHEPETDGSYIELVEFGMKDVQKAVDQTLGKLKEFARESLNQLTLGYLGDVVNGEYENVGMKEISDIPETTVRTVLNRIDDSILTEAHKDHLFSVINSVRSSETPGEREKIICHYFLKLLRFQESLQDKEKQITAFCDLCSEYIVDKQFLYDNPTFTFKIVPKDERLRERGISLSDLSSGEKQIVSLFSHLYLSGHRNFFVLIDEPELSLSVPWQRRFLLDITNGKFCKGLVAVTHSPFIYENELRTYTHSLGEFIGV